MNAAAAELIKEYVVAYEEAQGIVANCVWYCFTQHYADISYADNFLQTASDYYRRGLPMPACGAG